MTETAVWPNDVMSSPQMLPRKDPFRVICLLLSPFKPKDHFDSVRDAVITACKYCDSDMGIPVDCLRIDSLIESKPIHDDIWRYTQLADVIVIDITGFNPNVMFEYGVAAAVRRPHQVILIKSKEDDSRQPFDVAAHRYLEYSRSVTGDGQFVGRLAASIAQASTPAPYVPPTASSLRNGFTTIDLRHGDRPDLLCAPAITHRRLIDDGLEFGSLYIFRNSWIRLTHSMYRNVRARVTFRFQDEVPEGGAHFSVGVRSQHFLANWAGFLAVVRRDGTVWHTEPKDDIGQYDDVQDGVLHGFADQKDIFRELVIEINDERLNINYGALHVSRPLKELRHVPGIGYATLAAWRCRICVQEVELTPL
jgi:hypothetical protein